jgi:hypothetical protein
MHNSISIIKSAAITLSFASIPFALMACSWT